MIRLAELIHRDGIRIHVASLEQGSSSAGQEEGISCVFVVEDLYRVTITGGKIEERGGKNILCILFYTLTNVSNKDLCAELEPCVVNVVKHCPGNIVRDSASQSSNTAEYVLQHSFRRTGERCINPCLFLVIPFLQGLFVVITASRNSHSNITKLRQGRASPRGEACSHRSARQAKCHHRSHVRRCAHRVKRSLR